MTLKKLRLSLLAAIALLGAAVLFSWKLDFLASPLRSSLEDLTGCRVSFDRVEYRLFNRLTIQRLSVGSSFRCDTVTVYANPWQLLTSPRSPERALQRIHFSQPDVAVTPELNAVIRKLTAQKSSPARDSYKISWENARIAWGTHVADRISGQAITGPSLSVRLSGFLNDERLSLAYSLAGGAEHASLKVKGPSSDGLIDYAGSVTAYGARSGTIGTMRFRTGDFNLQTASGTLKTGPGGFSAELANTAFSLRAGGTAERWAIAGAADLGKLMPGSSGSVTMELSGDGDTINGSLHSTTAIIRARPFGALNLSFRKKPDNSWSGGGNLLPAGYTFTAAGNAGRVRIALQSPSSGYGTLSGTLAPLDLAVSFTAWPIDSLPLMPKGIAPVSGSVDAAGAVRSSGFDINLAAANVKAPGGNPQSINAHLYSNAGNWFLRSESGNKKWTLSANCFTDSRWEVSAAFDSCPARDMLQFLAVPPGFDASISGSARLASGREGQLNLTAKDILVRGAQLGSGKIEGSFDNKALTLKEAVLHHGRGTVTANGSLGLGSPLERSRIVLIFHQYPSPAGVINGSMAVEGTLSGGKDEFFTGSLHGDRIRVGDWFFRTARVPLTFTRDAVESRDLRLDTLVKGTARYGFGDDRIGGNLILSGIPLSRFTRRISGKLYGRATIGGTTAAPSVELDYSVPDTRYGRYAFSHEARINYRNGTIHAEKIVVSSATARIELAGKVWPLLNMTGDIRHLSLPAAASAAGIQTKLGGSCAGSLRLTGPVTAPEAALQLSGKNITIDSLPFSEIAIGCAYSSGTVTISRASARFKDSEVRVVSDSWLRTADQTFRLNTEWHNVHAGPADIFGGVLMTGSWRLAAGSPVITGTLTTAKNFWLNRHNLSRALLHFTFGNGVLTLDPAADSKPLVSGSINFNVLPSIRFSGFGIKSGQSSLSLDGIAGPRELNLTLTANAVDAASASELIDLPVDIAGSADATIIAKGSAESPQIEGSLNIANGTVAEVPFDNVNMQFSVRNQVLTLSRARLIKKEQYTLAAGGFVPFFLDSAGRKKASGQPLDLTVSIEQGSLGLLSALTSDIGSGNGALNAQVRFSGTLGKPVTNGYLRIDNGSLAVRRYVGKLTNISVDCVLKDSLLTFRELSARSGSGQVRGRGSITFDGISPQAFDVVLFTDGRKGIPVSIPELPIPSPLFKSDELKLFSNLSHGEPRFYVRLSGSSESPTLSGWVSLESTHFTFPPVGAGGDASDSPLYPFYARMNWDLDIRTGKNTWYDNELVGVNVLGGIKLGGKGLSPTVDGKIEAVRGNISYLGTNFTIRRAQLEIVKDTVYLEGEGYTETMVKGYGTSPDTTDTIQMFIDRAEIGKIKPRFVSKNNPSLSQEKALARATNADAETYAGSDQDFMLRQQLVRLVDSTLATPLAKSLLIKSGLLDSFRVAYAKGQQTSKPQDPANPSFTDIIAGTTYTMEKFVTDQVLVGYSLTFDKIENRLDLRHELELSYRLQKNLFVRAIYGIESQDTMRPSDRRIMIDKTWRFNLSTKKK